MVFFPSLMIFALPMHAVSDVCAPSTLGDGQARPQHHHMLIQTKVNRSMAASKRQTYIVTDRLPSSCPSGYFPIYGESSCQDAAESVGFNFRGYPTETHIKSWCGVIGCSASLDWNDAFLETKPETYRTDRPLADCALICGSEGPARAREDYECWCQDHGYGAIGLSCPSHGAEQCGSCLEGYEKSGVKCVAKTCTVGLPSQLDSTVSDGDCPGKTTGQRCEFSCKDGYFREDSSFARPLKCSCSSNGHFSCDRDFTCTYGTRATCASVTSCPGQSIPFPDFASRECTSNHCDTSTPGAVDTQRCCADEYAVADKGSTTCASGYGIIESDEQCREANSEFGYIYQSISSDTWSHAKGWCALKACYVFMYDNPGANSAFFETEPNFYRPADANCQLVCKRLPPSPSPTPLPTSPTPSPTSPTPSSPPPCMPRCLKNTNTWSKKCGWKTPSNQYLCSGCKPCVKPLVKL